MVALLCASIRGEGRGEDVADRWSALLLKMCNSAPKTAATETGSGLSATAGDLFGGLGVTRGVPVERLYREIRALRIYEGTSEIQRWVIGEALRRAQP